MYNKPAQEIDRKDNEWISIRRYRGIIISVKEEYCYDTLTNMVNIEMPGEYAHLINYISQYGHESGMRTTAIFGKMVEQMVNDGIHTKVAMIGEISIV